jgi:hypothetical protein
MEAADLASPGFAIERGERFWHLEKRVRDVNVLYGKKVKSC